MMDEENERIGHSPLGIASCILAVMGGGLLAWAWLSDNWSPFWLLPIVQITFHLAGLVLGYRAKILQKNEKKWFVTVGIILNWLLLPLFPLWLLTMFLLLLLALVGVFS